MARKLCVVLLAALLLGTTGCMLGALEEWLDEDDSFGDDSWSGDSNAVDTVGNAEILTERYGEDDTWAVYWYLCGSDLESGNGAASSDMEEMLAAFPGEKVTCVIQTGGAQDWSMDEVSADASQRFVYDDEGLRLVEENPVANMGDAATLESFLRFCTAQYPADHAALVFWNHGGGSVGGIAYDEQFHFDSLSLVEVSTAMEAVYGDTPETPPLELVGFDACLMASIDTAAALQGYAKYMVASQELEPGIGWEYTGIVEALAGTPGITGAGLGQVICDSYAAACRDYGLAEDITLSVIDLTRLDVLLDAYHNAGVEYLAAAVADASFFGKYSRGAKTAENYGGNTREDGFTNMVDLGDLVWNSKNLLPQSANAVIAALEDCVVYKINGPYRSHANGLSCYYAYDRDEGMLREYANVAAREPYVYLSEYAVTGGLSQEGRQYIESMAFEPLPDGSEQLPESSGASEAPTLPDTVEPPPIQSVETLELEDFPVTVSDDGLAVLNLGPEIAAQIEGVYVQLIYYDEAEDIMLLLGRDNDLDADWDAGVFRDNFRGLWGAIDGCLTYMEIVFEGEDYNLYTVPILLNGEEYNLRVSYDYNDEQYHILGARKGIEDNGLSDRNLQLLKPGDVITTLHYAMTLSGDADEDPQLLLVDEITVTGDTGYHEEDMGDGNFLLMYEMVDVSGGWAFSDLIEITVEGEDIYLSELEE